MDAETCALATALLDRNVALETGARVRRLVSGDRGRIAAVEYEQHGTVKRLTPEIVVLSAGAVNSAALLLASGIANRSGAVGRYFMNHNSTAMIAVNPLFRNDAVHQKTFGLNDFYLADGNGRPPLGNIQLFGRMSGGVMKSAARRTPIFALDLVARHSVDFLAQSEDLPDPESRILVDGERIVFQWKRTNLTPHYRLVREMKAVLREIGFPLVLTWSFDKRTTSHQCGTVRIRQRSGDRTAGPLLPCLRPLQFVRGRCGVHAECGCGQSGPDDCRTSPPCRRPHPGTPLRHIVCRSEE